MTSTANNWALFYLNLESNWEVNLQMAQIMAFNRNPSSWADCISIVAANLGLSILVVNGFNGMFLFHAVHDQNQNVFCPESKMWALSGGGLRADCYHLHPNSLFQDIEFQTLSWRDLKAASTGEAVSALQVPEQNPFVS
jgi:hypothetical protein